MNETSVKLLWDAESPSIAVKLDIFVKNEKES